MKVRVRRSAYVAVDEQKVKDKGHKVLNMTWVDRQKGDEVRSRVCIQDFAHGEKNDAFWAPTPSEEAIAIMEAICVAKGYYTRTADVSVAFLHAECDEELYIRPPEEWRNENPG